MDKRKKVQVWLSPMEFKVLSDYCERKSVSFYSVLKEGMNRVILGEGVSQEPSLNTEPKIQGKDYTSPSSFDSPKLQKFEERFTWLEKQIDKMTGNEELWREVSELKAGLAQLTERVSGLSDKMEELKVEIEEEVEETMVRVLGNYTKSSRRG